jgi:hypothetical protein
LGATNSHRDITNRNQPLLFFHMDPTNSNVFVWTRKSFVECLVSCRVGFQQNLGQKSVMDPSCQHNFWGHQQPYCLKNDRQPNFHLPKSRTSHHKWIRWQAMQHWIRLLLWWIEPKINYKAITHRLLIRQRHTTSLPRNHTPTKSFNANCTQLRFPQNIP